MYRDMSERKINLNEILDNYLLVGYSQTKEKISEKYHSLIIGAMKKACEQILELAAERADTTAIHFGMGEITVIDKESILNTINQIE